MPVLCQDDVLERSGDAIDKRNDFIGPGNGERAASAEVLLHVDHEKDVGFAGFDGAAHGLAPSWARRRSVSSARRNRGSDIVTG